MLQASSISTGATVVREKERKRKLGLKKTDIPKTTSSWHSAKEIVRLKGVLGLWSGFRLHFGKVSLSIFWIIYKKKEA